MMAFFSSTRNAPVLRQFAQSSTRIFEVRSKVIPLLVDALLEAVIMAVAATSRGDSGAIQPR